MPLTGETYKTKSSSKCRHLNGGIKKKPQKPQNKKQTQIIARLDFPVFV